MGAEVDVQEEVETLIQLARQLLAGKSFRQAVVVARTITRLAPNDPQGWFLTGSAHLGMGEAAEARICLENAIQRDGTRLQYCQSMAQLNMQLGEMKEAMDWCEQGLALERNSKDLYRMLGLAKACAGDLEGACECLEKCVSLDPGDASARAELGTLYTRRNSYELAIEQYLAALRTGTTSQSASLWANLGHCYSRQGNLSEAVEAFRNAVAFEPKDAGYLYNLGDALLAIGQPAKAVPALLGAVSLRPDYPLAQYDLGLAFFGLGRYEEGAVASEAALANDPEMKVQQSNLGIGATNNLGLCLNNQGRHEDALACFERNLQLFATTYFNIGLAQFRLRRFNDALASFSKALDIKPDDAEYLDLLGNAHLELGQLVEGKAVLERAISVNPQYALAHYDLGTVLAKGTELERALSCFEKAFAIDPNLYWAYYSAGCIHARAGRMAPALELIEQALQKGLTDFEHVRTDSDLDQLRKDDRFVELIGRYQTA